MTDFTTLTRADLNAELRARLAEKIGREPTEEEVDQLRAMLIDSLSDAIAADMLKSRGNAPKGIMRWAHRQGKLIDAANRGIRRNDGT